MTIEKGDRLPDIRPVRARVEIPKNWTVEQLANHAATKDWLNVEYDVKSGQFYARRLDVEFYLVSDFVPPREFGNRRSNRGHKGDRR